MNQDRANRSARRFVSVAFILLFSFFGFFCLSCAVRGGGEEGKSASNVCQLPGYYSAEGRLPFYCTSEAGEDRFCADFKRAACRRIGGCSFYTEHRFDLFCRGTLKKLCYYLFVCLVKKEDIACLLFREQMRRWGVKN